MLPNLAGMSSNAARWHLAVAPPLPSCQRPKASVRCCLAALLLRCLPVLPNIAGMDSMLRVTTRNSSLIMSLRCCLAAAPLAHAAYIYMVATGSMVRVGHRRRATADLSTVA